MMNMAPKFLRHSLQFGIYANNTALRIALFQWSYSSRNNGASPTVLAGHGTGADDDNRMQLDSQESQKEGQRRTPRPARNSHKQQQAIHATLARTVAEQDNG